MGIGEVNADVFAELARFLSVDQVAAMRMASKQLKWATDQFVIPVQLNAIKRKHFYDSYTSKSTTDYHKLLAFSNTDENWHTASSRTTQLLHTHSSIPVLVAHHNLLILGSRSAVFVWDRRRTRYTRFIISNQNRASMDITGLVVLQYNGAFLSLMSSHVAGLVQRVVLNLDTKKCSQTAIYNAGGPWMDVTRSQNVRTLKGDHEAVISAREIGRLDVLSPNSPWSKPASVDVETSRLWGVDWNRRSGLLTVSHNYNSTTQSSVSLYRATQDGICADGHIDTPNKESSFTATNGTSTNGVLASPDITVVGYYDSSVRVYDHRCSRQSEVQCYQDNLDPQPIYSVDVGGAHDSMICAGSSLYSRLRVIDARMPTNQALHIYAADSSDRSSPVYQLQVDHSHCYLATDCKVHDINFSTDAPNERFATARV
ncbi:hypothetical protein E3P99_01153 [Wallemia hederae]|uniref:F-box domain-containing protein n=1 Tax=Wallemia hederae TaxID=1540922 RepID=A0A4T0FWA7_9BASI|nr:hypothetical protein E3P99_01153 [Wallemia hederae]